MTRPALEAVGDPHAVAGCRDRRRGRRLRHPDPADPRRPPQKPALVDLFTTAAHHRATRIMLSGTSRRCRRPRPTGCWCPPKDGPRLGTTSKTTAPRPAGSSAPPPGTRWRYGSPGNGSAPTDRPSLGTGSHAAAVPGPGEGTARPSRRLTHRDRTEHLGVLAAERPGPAPPGAGPGRADPPHLRSAPHRAPGRRPLPLRLRGLPAPDPGENGDPWVLLRGRPVHVLRAVPRGRRRRPPADETRGTGLG